MKDKFLNRVYWFFAIGYKFIFNRTIIRGCYRSNLVMGKNVKIKKSRVYLEEDSLLEIGDNVILENIDLRVKGVVSIGKNCKIFGSGFRHNYIDVIGKMTLGVNNRLETNVRVRFNGVLKIGDYNNINTNSEIRCDESVTIGNFNQISYDVMIWDTNTHNIYSAEDRRNITINNGIGYEFQKPKTKNIVIGDDCWIGKRASILKGTHIGNKCIVGYAVILVNQKVVDNTTIVTDFNYKVIKNNI